MERALIRKNIVDVLDLTADPVAQIKYQRDAAIVNVGNEMIEQWFDWYWPDDADFRAAFSADELAALAAYTVVVREVCDSTPRFLPPIEELVDLPSWQRLVECAQVTLAALRGGQKRRRVIDTGPARGASSGVDLRASPVTSLRAARCPRCASAFSALRADDLRRKHVSWRCGPGEEPSSFDVRCPACGAVSLVHVSRDGVLFATEREAKTLREAARERERSKIGDAWEDE